MNTDDALRQLDGQLRSAVAFFLPDAHVFMKRRTTELPGYFRATKDWDLVVVVDGTLLAVIEFKSQVGPSFGNNFNNRTEEAVGNATDL